MQITQREKYFLLAGALFFVGLLAFFVIKNSADYLISIDEKLADLQYEEETIEKLGMEFQQLQSLKSGGQMNLEPMVPQIETILQRFGLLDLARLSPSDSIIENKYLKRQVSIEFREAPAMQILQFIKAIEDNAGIPMTIEEFSERPIVKKPGIYWVSMKISAFQNKGQ